MKKVYTTALVILIVVGFFFAVTTNIKQTSDSILNKTMPEVLLIVPPQEVSTTVFIERIVLNNPGFLAVRSIENGRLGQIIEISSYLKEGAHESITIDIGESYDGTSALIVVAYSDIENDQIFNDLDQPMRDPNNNAVAKYVGTGETVLSQLFNKMYESEPHIMGDMKIVRYTNTGYVPAQLEVPVGTMVTFINESDRDMWVASNKHPSHTDLPTFDQFSPSAKASSYTYTFDQIGTWSFHDHLQPAHKGLINVI